MDNIKLKKPLNLTTINISFTID
uniref:Uncharacterized protein n=1 Tax=Tetranychus urticae TaxID=32264 RepID=T1KVN9_TETUR